MNTVYRLAGRWLNRCPAWMAAWAPEPVLHAAIDEMHRDTARAIADARLALVMRGLRERVAQLEREGQGQ